MARRGRDCVVAGCAKKAAVGSVVCAEHRDTALGEQTDREIMKMTQRLQAMAKYEEGEEKREAAQLFRRQVARGDYAVLFSSEMVQSLTEEGKGYDLQQEIGMMRMAMLRLMLEEENPSRLAHGLAKLSGALGKSMERQGMWAKEAQQRRNVQQYLASLEEPRRMVEVPVAMETREAASEIAVEPVKEEAVEPEFKASEWPRAGYPDYYMDVEDLKKHGK